MIKLADCRRTPRPIWGPALHCLLPFILCLLVVPTFGHDPGLSAAELKLEAGRLSANLSFLFTDLEALVMVDTDLDRRISDAEFAAARTKLEELARHSLEVKYDGRIVPPTDVSVRLDESNTIHLALNYAGQPDEQLSVRAAVVSQLPRGHRQYFTLKNAQGQLLAERLFDAGNLAAEFGPAELAAARTAWQTFRYFIVLGVEHILTGYDHLAFLVALLIASVNLRGVLKIVTSFTVAHSITLALATFNLVTLSPAIVEPMIALSIVYVGLENVWRGRRQEELEHRWLLTFAFGLIHGFGFASVLRELEIGANGGGVAIPLVSFNLGVEAGQLAIAALLWPLIWKLRERPAFAARYVPACSLLVALVGAYWLVRRTLL